MKRHFLPVVLVGLILAFAASSTSQPHRRRVVWTDPWCNSWRGFGCDPRVIYFPAPLDPRYAYIDTDVSPEAARVYLDGQFVGIADDFDGAPRYLVVDPGRHTLRFRPPGGPPMSMKVMAPAGQVIEIDRDLDDEE